MDQKIAVARCHEIQLALKDKNVNSFQTIHEIGMAVQLALHIRGLEAIDYMRLKKVSNAVFGINQWVIETILRDLEKLEFIKIIGAGNEKKILPLVPHYEEDFYGSFANLLTTEKNQTEHEELTLALVNDLAGSPCNIDTLRTRLGADKKLFSDSIELGNKGSYLLQRRARGKDIIINPTYFSENADIFADHVAGHGAKSISALLQLIKKVQGWPLIEIIRNKEIAGVKIDDDSISFLKRLAQDGMVKPPSITTSHSGLNHFIFTPTPNTAKISPFKRETYEKAMAIVAAIRQGQLLPNKYKIRSPGAVLYTLKSELKLKPTTDYSQQYANLVHLRVAKLVELSGGYTQLQVIDQPDNKEALNIAYSLIDSGDSCQSSTDDDLVKAMSASDEYVESLLAAKRMRESETISLSEDKKFEMEQLVLGFN